MRKILVVVVAICGLVLASPAFAQDEAKSWDKRVFAFGGGGAEIGYGSASFFHVGGGFETVHSSGFGFAFDLGYQELTEFNFGVVSLSPALMYELPVNGKLKPYARVGLGWITDGEGAAGFWNIGGGVNYFFRERTGIKVEVRDSFQGAYLDNGMLEVLAGVVFKF